MKPQAPRPRLVAVIRDCKNPKLDYALPAARAEKLFAQGVLLWDMAHRAFVTRDQWAMPQ